MCNISTFFLKNGSNDPHLHRDETGISYQHLILCGAKTLVFDDNTFFCGYSCIMNNSFRRL